MTVPMHFSDGKPVGDGLGPLVAGILMKDLSDDELNYHEDMIIGEMEYRRQKYFYSTCKGTRCKDWKNWKNSYHQFWKKRI